MKILFVADTYYPHINGVYYFIKRLALSLKDKGHEVAVLAPSTTLNHTRRKIDNIEVFGVASFSVLLYKTIRIPIPFFLKSHLKQIIKDFSPDIIHLQNHFVLNKNVIRVNKGLGIPIIATNHFMAENLTSFLKYSKAKKTVESWLWSGFSKTFNHVSLVTTPSKFAADLIRFKLKVNVIAISNGIDLKEFSPGEDDQNVRAKYGIPNKPVLLYAGRLDPEKHIDEILHAIALGKSNNDFCFVVVGKGAKKPRLERLAKQLGIADKIIFTGFVPDEDLVTLYRCSRCFIIASTAELQSIATLQAMASGLPVIAAKAGALPELVYENENGHLFYPGDINQMAQSFHSIFSNNDLHNKMSKSSLKHIAQHDITNTVVMYEQLYKNVLKKNSKNYKCNIPVNSMGVYRISEMDKTTRR